MNIFFKKTVQETAVVFSLNEITSKIKIDHEYFPGLEVEKKKKNFTTLKLIDT